MRKWAPLRLTASGLAVEHVEAQAQQRIARGRGCEHTERLGSLPCVRRRQLLRAPKAVTLRHEVAYQRCVALVTEAPVEGWVRAMGFGAWGLGPGLGLGLGLRLGPARAGAG